MRRLFPLTLVLAACGSAPVPTAKPPGLDPQIDLAAKRAAAIERLHDYRLAGEFPTDEWQRPEGVFRDRAGRECPMAALISQSGHDDLVTIVARDNNRLRLADITSGPLMDWILESGLTKDEVVMIQGAMNIDYGQMNIRFNNDNGINLVNGNTGENVIVAAARHEIREKLRKAEAQLRATSGASLQIAATRLPQGAHVASQAPVVPKELVVKDAADPWPAPQPHRILAVRPQRP